MEFPAKLLNKRKEPVVSFVFNEKSQQVQASGQASLGAQPQDLSCDFCGDWGVTPTRMHSVVITVHCLLVQCVCQQSTGTAADHVRTGLRKGNTCLNMGISRGLKVAQLLAGFPDGITLYVGRPFVPREYQCFSWLGTAPSVYLCNLHAC